MSTRNQSAVTAGFLLASIVVLLIFVYAVGVERLTPEAIHSLVLSFGWWGPLIYIFLYTIRPLIFFPAIIFTLAGAMAFGPWLGTLYVILGGAFGAFLCFGVTRYFGRERFERIWGHHLQVAALRECTVEHGFRTMLFMRVVPLFPYDVISYAAGLSRIRFRDYASATIIGMIPGAVAYNFLGYSLNRLFSPMFFAALAVVVLIMFSPLVYHKVRKRRHTT